MKKTILFCILTFAFCFGIATSSQAQKTVIWKGGTPGRVSEWNCATNWREGRVPNEFSDVVIPDVSSGSNAFPVISSPVESVNSLTLLSGAQLMINRNGKLEVYFALETHGVCKLLNQGTLIAPSFRADSGHQQDCFRSIRRRTGYGLPEICQPETQNSQREMPASPPAPDRANLSRQNPTISAQGKIHP